MITVLDYIEKSNFTFDEKEVNDVDLLILSQFSMLKFEKVLKNINIDDNRFNFQDMLDIVSSVTNLNDYNNIKDLYAQELFEKLVPEIQDPVNLTLLKLLCSSKRFRDLQIKYHVDRFEADKEKQFSATCFIYKNKFSIMTFRGTDTSFVGWKEDFNLSYRKVIPAQVEALQYINTITRFLPKKLYVCGHSKGGNLAVYAAMYCKKDIKKNIKRVYSFDGPGFPREIANSEEYKSIISKTIKIVPENSIIGLLLNTLEPIKVIHSNEFWIMEHNIYSWELNEKFEFKFLKGVSDSAKRTKLSLNQFYESMSVENKTEFINEAYNILINTGATDFTTLINDLGKYLPIIMNQLTKIDKEKRNLLIDTFTSLGKFHLKNIVKKVD
jgi:hypothetical protein